MNSGNVYIYSASCFLLDINVFYCDNPSALGGRYVCAGWFLSLERASVGTCMVHEDFGDICGLDVGYVAQSTLERDIWVEEWIPVLWNATWELWRMKDNLLQGCLASATAGKKKSLYSIPCTSQNRQPGGHWVTNCPWLSLGLGEGTYLRTALACSEPLAEVGGLEHWSSLCLA